MLPFNLIRCGRGLEGLPYRISNGKMATKVVGVQCICKRAKGSMSGQGKLVYFLAQLTHCLL